MSSPTSVCITQTLRAAIQELDLPAGLSPWQSHLSPQLSD